MNKDRQRSRMILKDDPHPKDGVESMAELNELNKCLHRSIAAGVNCETPSQKKEKFISANGGCNHGSTTIME